MTIKKYKSDFDKLVKLTEQMSPEKGDKRYWKLGKDKSGNGMAIIRFLPEISDESRPVVTYWEHYFKGNNNQWLVEKCLRTVGQDCPICEANQQNWADDRTKAGKIKAKHYFLANVLVISDLVNKENEGKVFIFKFGEKIYNKLKKKISPDYEIEEKMNPFDLEDGADFILKGTTIKVNGEDSFSYDESTFKERSDLTKRYKKDELDSLLSERHNIEAELQVKSYDELEERFNKVMSVGKQKPAQVHAAKANANAIVSENGGDTLDSYEAADFDADTHNDELDSEEDFQKLLDN